MNRREVKAELTGFNCPIPLDHTTPELSEPSGAEAKAALTRIAKGRTATCVAQNRTWDRVAASCSIGGRDVGDLMRGAGIAEGGR